MPLFISYPQMKSKNRICHKPVSLLDIYPTLSALCGLPEQELHGVNLQPLLKNLDSERGRPVLTTRYYKNHSVRSQNWRYIRYRDGEEELYDHRADPKEHHNLASKAEHADVIKEHRKWLPRVDAFPAGKDSFPEDSYDKKVKLFQEEGVPNWLE